MEPYEHAEQARFLLSSAVHPAIAANRLLLSEVLWGAAAQSVKAAAQFHNLRHRSHRDLFRAVRWIASNILQDPELINNFGRAGDLHANFYEGNLSAAEIAEYRATTVQFVAKMQRIINAP